MTVMSTEQVTAAKENHAALKAARAKWQYAVGDIIRVTADYSPEGDQATVAEERMVGQIGKVLYVPGQHVAGTRNADFPRNGFGEYIVVKLMAGWVNAEGRNEWHVKAEELTPLTKDDTVVTE